MTGNAPLDFHGSVLEYVGTAFFGMACDASLPIRLLQHWCVSSAVRIVAIRALHETFAHFVPVRQRELTLDRFVAGEAEAGLRCAQHLVIEPLNFSRSPGFCKELWLATHQLRQLFGGNSGQVRRVTSLAIQSVEFVFGSLKLSQLLHLDVAC